MSYVPQPERVVGGLQIVHLHATGTADIDAAQHRNEDRHGERSVNPLVPGARETASVGLRQTGKLASDRAETGGDATRCCVPACMSRNSRWIVPARNAVVPADL